MGIKYTIRAFLSSYTWDLAIGHYDESIVKNGIDWKRITFIHNPYKNKWFADPFILKEDDSCIQLLVEEFDSEVNKGRIARLVVSKTSYSIEECKIILELETHLSFPAIYNIGEAIYVHPENSKSGKSTIYRYDIQQDKLVEPIVLLNEPLTDAVIIKQGGEYYMYSTVLQQNGGPWLYVYRSNLLTAPFKNIDKIDFGQRTARMAGAMLDTQLGMIRPAQDCTHDYGEAVLFYKDKEIIGEIRPNCNGRYAGVHTFNTLGSTFVIDLKKYKNLRLRRLVMKLLGKK